MGRRVLPVTLLAMMACLLSCQSQADDEAPNHPHISTDEYGRCYARSVPKYNYDPGDEPRQQGTTTTWYVTKDGDIPVDTYDWYSGRVYVKCSMGGSTRTAPNGTLLPVIHLVRQGPWHRRPPGEDDLAIAFYRDGKLLKSYTTFDIAGAGKRPRRCGYLYENMVGSVSHYIVFAWHPSPRLDSIEMEKEFVDGFEATTVDGRKLLFRLDTGELVSTEKVPEPDKVLPRFETCRPAPRPEEKN